MSTILHNVKSNCEYEEYEIPFPDSAKHEEEQGIEGIHMREFSIVIRRVLVSIAEFL